ncbi:DUF1501 domain-containing protein [soil metagenome]
MSEINQEHGCPEYLELSRRGFLRFTGVSAAAAAVLSSAPAWLPRVAFAGTPPTGPRDVVVQIFLRGAADGLSMIVPFNDPAYTAATCRPTLRVYAPDDMTQPVGRRAIALANSHIVGGSSSFDFGLHPTMQGLVPAYLDGKLLLMQAAGLTSTNKSHFDAQRWMENGQPQSNSLLTGWLGRHLASIPPVNPNSAIRALGVADGLQRTLIGAPQALPVPNFSSNPGNVPLLNNLAAPSPTNLSGYGLSGNASTSALRSGILNAVYDQSGGDLTDSTNNTLNTITRLNQIGAPGYAPAGGAVYPSSTLGYALRSSAALINANDDAQVNQFVEAIAIDVSTWDTHSAQYAFNATTGVFTGSMVTRMVELANALGAFYQDLIFTRGKRVTVVVMSEFGRRIGENGTTGTDHGYGNMMMVLGTGVIGGRVLATWNGLPTGIPATNLDVPVTTDIRNVLAEIVSKRLQNGAGLASIFPGFTPNFLNVVT